MTSYVRRVSPEGRVGYTGPIRSDRQVEREAQAWRDSGWQAEVLASTPEVRRMVRQWQKDRAAERAR